MRTLAAGLMRVWRATIGAVIPDSCRFTPSCSHYAAEALQRRGLLLGSALTVWRLLRCHPFHPGGYDPVVRSKPACLKRGGGATSQGWWGRGGGRRARQTRGCGLDS